MLLLLLPHKHDCGQNEEKSKFWRPFRIFIVSEQITLAATQSCSTERGGLRKGYKHDISISARTFRSHLFDLSCIVLGKQTQPATRHKVNAQIKWKKVLVSGGLTSRRFSKKSICATKTFERSRFYCKFSRNQPTGLCFLRFAMIQTFTYLYSSRWSPPRWLSWICEWIQLSHLDRDQLLCHKNMYLC